MLLPQSIERLIIQGGSVSIDASKYIPQSLERFANIASQSKTAVLILRNCQYLLPQTMERIAIIGKGKVTFF